MGKYYDHETIGSDDGDVQSLATDAESLPWDQLSSNSSKAKGSSGGRNQSNASVPSTESSSSQKMSQPASSDGGSDNRGGGPYQLPPTYASSVHDGESVSGTSMSDVSIGTERNYVERLVGSMDSPKRDNTTTKDDTVNASQLFAQEDISKESSSSALECKKNDDDSESNSVAVNPTMLAGLVVRLDKKRLEDAVSVSSTGTKPRNEASHPFCPENVLKNIVSVRMSKSQHLVSAEEDVDFTQDKSVGEDVSVDDEDIMSVSDSSATNGLSFMKQDGATLAVSGGASMAEGADLSRDGDTIALSFGACTDEGSDLSTKRETLAVSNGASMSGEAEPSLVVDVSESTKPIIGTAQNSLLRFVIHGGLSTKNRSVAQEEPKERLPVQKQKWFRRTIIALLLVVIGAIIVVVAASASQNSSSARGTNHSKPSPVSPPVPTMQANVTLAPTGSPVSGPPSVPTSTLLLRGFVDDYLAGTVGIPINEWDVSGVSDFSQLFSADRNPAAAEFNEDLDGWNTSNAETFAGLFQNAKAFNGNIETWDTSRVTNMEKAFEGAEFFNRDLSGWKTGSVSNFYALFRGAVRFNSVITEWNTSSAQNYSHIFSGCLDFNKPLLWDTSNAVDMSRMFQNAEKFNQDLSFDTSGVTNMDGMFQGARNLDRDLDFNTSSVTSMHSMFMDAESYTGGGLSLFDVSRVTTAKQMFSGASSLQGDGLGQWDVQSLENAESMFAGASHFEQNLCGWYSRVPAMLLVTGMFEGTRCSMPEPDLNTGSSFCTPCGKTS